MKFSEALAVEESAATKGPKCGVAAIFDKLDKEDQAALKAALASSTAHAFIVRALTSIGHKVPAGTVARHRKGECSCE